MVGAPSPRLQLRYDYEDWSRLLVLVLMNKYTAVCDSVGGVENFDVKIAGSTLKVEHVLDNNEYTQQYISTCFQLFTWSFYFAACLILRSMRTYTYLSKPSGAGKEWRAVEDQKGCVHISSERCPKSSALHIDIYCHRRSQICSPLLGIFACLRAIRTFVQSLLLELSIKP